MCCFFTALILLGPRMAVVVAWWLNPVRFADAFGGILWPILGIIFLPWTTLAYLIVWSPTGGIYGLAWLWIGLGVVADVAMHAGGGYGNRRRIPGYRG